MTLLKALRKMMAPLLALAAAGSAVADEPALPSRLAQEVVGFHRDLLSMEQTLEARKGEDRLAVYLDLGRVDALKLEAVSIAIDGKPVASRRFDEIQRRALRDGAMIKLYVGALAPGAHELHATLEGRFEGAYRHDKRYPFEKAPGASIMRVAIIDVMHQKQSELVFYPEFVFHHE